MIVLRGEVYVDTVHIDVLKDEAEYVKGRYHAVARTLAKGYIPNSLSSCEIEA